MVGVIESLSNSTPLIKVTPGVIQILCSTLSKWHYTSAILEPLAQHQYYDAFVQYTQGYNGQISDSPELMLNIMLECSKAYSQQFYPLLAGVTYVLQSLRSTHSLITHVLQGLCPTLLSFTCSGYLCAPELTLNTQSHNPCAPGLMPNTFIFYLLGLPMWSSA